MPAPKNTFKAALMEKRPQIGLWLALANPYTAEILGDAGYDWLLIDGEHAPNDIPLMMAQLQALKGSPSHPIIRAPIGEAWLLKQILDIGAQTVLVPMVESGDQAKAMVRAVRYPPQGMRGVGAALARASAFNRIPTTCRRPMRRFACCCRSKVAPDWQHSMTSPPPTASTAFLSDQPILPPTWAISAGRRCRGAAGGGSGADPYPGARQGRGYPDRRSGAGQALPGTRRQFRRHWKRCQPAGERRLAPVVRFSKGKCRRHRKFGHGKGLLKRLATFRLADGAICLWFSACRDRNRAVMRDMLETPLSSGSAPEARRAVLQSAAVSGCTPRLIKGRQGRRCFRSVSTRHGEWERNVSDTRSPIPDGQNIRHSIPFSDQKLLLSWGPKYRFPAQAFCERVYGHA